MTFTLPPKLLADLRILFVEDTIVVKTLATIIKLRSGAIDVPHATSVPWAKQLLGISAPLINIAIIDYGLVDSETGAGTGSDLANWMRGQPHLQQTLRVCFTSNFPDVVYANQPVCTEPLYHLFLTKPMGGDSIIKEVSQAWRDLNPAK